MTVSGAVLAMVESVCRVLESGHQSRLGFSAHTGWDSGQGQDTRGSRGVPMAPAKELDQPIVDGIHSQVGRGVAVPVHSRLTMGIPV